MAYKIQFEKAAAKQLSKLERQVQVKIAEKINAMAFDPRLTVTKNWLMKAERAASKSAVIGFSMIFSTMF